MDSGEFRLASSPNSELTTGGRFVRPGSRPAQRGIAALLPLLLLSAPLCAQDPEIGQAPPPLLTISRNSIAGGKLPLFARVAAEYSRYLKGVNWPSSYVALRPVTGPGDALILTGYDSFESWGHDREEIEKSSVLKGKMEQFAAQSGELVAQRREISAILQPEISYRAKFDWSKVRYFDVITILTIPGHGDEYLQNRKIVVEAHTKAQVDEHLLVYQVSSGVPGTTYFVIRPAETFEGLDLEKRHGEHYDRTLGEKNRARLHELFAASVLTQEEEYYAVDPAMSYVTAAWAGAEHAFWFGKP